MRTRSSAVVAGCALLVGLLCGCTGAPGDGSSTSGSPTRSSTAKASATPKATSTPTPGASTAPPAADPGTGAAGQTVAEACGIMATALDALSTQSDAQDLDALQGDPAAAAAAFASSAATVKDAAGKVANPDVQPAAGAIAAAADGYFSALASLLADPESADTEQLDAGVLAYSQAESDLDQICAT